MNKVIEIRECSAAYGENAVLHKVSLTIEQGELVVIIGPSGCGKTTLLKMINGIVTPTEGEVIVNGEALASCDLVALRRQIGYAVQGETFSAYDGPGQYLLRSRSGEEDDGRRETASGRADAGDGAAAGTSGRALSAAAFGRPAAAGGNRQGHGGGCRDFAYGRAFWCSG